MSLLKAEPPAAVTSLEELFAIAHAMETEAANRYAEIAKRMRAEGDPRLADVFERLSAEERGHIDRVAHWSHSQRGKAPDPALIRWEIPQTFDDEGTAAGDPRLVSAYRALAMAVRNEERAFAFWSYVAAQTEVPEVRNAAEAMAREELGHVAILRRERRHAFHAERQDAGAGARDENVLDIATLERRLAEHLIDLAGTASGDRRKRLLELSAEAKNSAETLERFPSTLAGLAPIRGVPDDPIAQAELVTERLLEAADRIRDEAALNRLQELAGQSIKRLAWLRADLPELTRP